MISPVSSQVPAQMNLASGTLIRQASKIYCFGISDLNLSHKKKIHVMLSHAYSCIYHFHSLFWYTHKTPLFTPAPRSSALQRDVMIDSRRGRFLSSHTDSYLEMLFKKVWHHADAHIITTITHVDAPDTDYAV